MIHTAGLTDRVEPGVLTRVLPRDLVDEVPNATGKNEQRKRLLPARVVVYYVLALTLFYGGATRKCYRSSSRAWGSCARGEKHAPSVPVNPDHEAWS